MAGWAVGSKRHGPHDGHDEKEVTDDAAKRPCLAGTDQLTEADSPIFDVRRASGPGEGFAASSSVDCLMNTFQSRDDVTQTVSYTETEPLLADFEYGKASVKEAPQQTPMEEYNDIEDNRPKASNEDLPPPHDTCFGVITVSAISEYNENKKSLSPVSVEHGKAMLRLHFKSSGEYAGFVKSELLAQLLQRKSISVDGKIGAPKKDDTLSKSPGECELRLVVYGCKSEADAIGNALGDSSFCLQHPTANDLEPSMDYHNPHLLLRPGSEMPRLELLSIESDAEGAKLDTIDEYSKAHVMRLFDQAIHSFTKFEFPSSPRLKSFLNRHQVEAANWLWTMESGQVTHNETPSLWKPHAEHFLHQITGNRMKKPTPFYGGILADEMGLGKTLSMLALVCGSLDLQTQIKGPGTGRGGSRATLVVTPLSTMHNWELQCKRHVHPGQLKWTIYHGQNKGKKLKTLREQDIVFTTYGTMRRDWVAQGSLYSEKWHRVILDEAHHIRSRSSQTFKAACELSGLRRWCVTGTPVHNSLDDLGALLSFVRVPKLMEPKIFRRWITEPNKVDDSISLKRLELLISATSLRRTKQSADLGVSLPSKSERIISVDLTPQDRKLYTFFEARAAKLAQGMFEKTRAKGPRSKGSGSPGYAEKQKESNILSLIGLLRMICNGGESLLSTSALLAWRNKDADSVDLKMMQTVEMDCVLCEKPESQLGTCRQFPCHHIACWTCLDSREQNEPRMESICPNCSTTPSGGSSTLTSTSKPGGGGAKLALLIENLHRDRSLAIDDRGGPVKSVVFSTWTRSLDLVQKELEKTDIKFQRIDGQTSLTGRKNALDVFTGDSHCTVLLATVGSAGEGIDLTAANIVHLLEPSWNPMIEAQAIDRIHRIGQHREVMIKKYITRDSIETYVQWIQKNKIRLIERSLSSSASQTGVMDERIEVPSSVEPSLW